MLIIEDKYISIDKILSFDKQKNSYGAYYDKVMFFCQLWLSEHPVFKFRTSGSTSTPHTLYINRDQMLFNAQHAIKTFELKKGDTGFLCLSIDFIAAAMLLVRCMEAKMNVYVIPPTATFSDKILSLTFSIASFVPLQLKYLFNHVKGPYFLNRIKTTMVGGAPICFTLERKLMGLQTDVFHTFGMTETASYFALRKIEEIVPQKPVYHLVTGMEMSTDERGCLKLYGVLSANKWIQTNDKVLLINKSQFYWLGRMDWVINSGGIKISVELLEKQIENILYEENIQVSIAIAGKKCVKLGQKVVMYMEGNIDAVVEKKMYNLLKKKLPPYYFPKSFIHLQVFPRTKNKKLDRKKLHYKK